MFLPHQRIGALITEEFLATLDQMYPHRCPDPQDTEREIWMKAGERRLVDVLHAKYEEANESPPEDV